ncbi:MAG: DUF2953 domain-containing protein [Bacillota bacterium]
MWVLWTALLVLALLLALALWLPVQLEVEYHRLPGSWGTGLVSVRLLGGLVRVHHRLRVGERVDRAVQTWLDHRRRPQAAVAAALFPPPWRRLAAHALPRLLPVTNLRQADIALTVGTGDAASTALAAGALWSLVGGLYGYALSRVRRRPLRPPRISIRPDFRANDWQLSVDLRCIAQVSPGHIMGALLAAAGRLSVKGGVGRERSSHSGTHEDGHGKHQRHG